MEKNITKTTAEQFQKSILSATDPSLAEFVAERKNVFYTIDKLNERISGYSKTISDNQRAISALQQQIDVAISAAEDPQEYVVQIRNLETINADCHRWIEKSSAIIKEREKAASDTTKKIYIVLQAAIKTARPAVIDALNEKLSELQDTMDAWKTACKMINEQAPGIEITTTLSKISFIPNTTGRINCF